ncbi:putative glycerol-1-phosphate prenyltransferase [Flavobacterium arsenatis]|uniref:Geranylgeranylglyceryl phosphate synthase n=1 Tax=Flavobacterium arsenatis TaxID=1484332 RepID=A0ABU1TSQ8_9FLAO|nr:geranylgeranylglyceryl/heptaprenylglyceryl phosphate synthase [Flavobacterium arsenatis]MDR6968918.1 putative glycerol-1-phosphate prenyltransferase [Flavobacterium arsenatis]
MKNIYSEILEAKSQKRKLLAILLDPDKIIWQAMNDLILKINQSPATHIFIGGSLVFSDKIDELILKIKEKCDLPVVLFPGNPTQISNKADGILFLSLISGRNPDYLIEHQVKAVPILKRTNLEIISTGYILIEGGNETAVSKVSQTKPISRVRFQEVLHTAQAGEMLGNKLIYLEAGSGAHLSVPSEIIELVSKNIEIPLIVGGGIKSQNEIQKAYTFGADLVVIGTAFENDNNFFNNH